MFVILLLIYIILPSYAYAYIDPGSGGVLFTTFIALISSIVFTLRASFYNILSFVYKLFSKDIRMNNSGIVIHSEGRQYWSVFKPIVDELEHRKIIYRYLTTDDLDPALSYPVKYGSMIFIGKPSNRSYSILNFLKADIVLTTTPGLDVYQVKRSKGVKHYSHIMHTLREPVYRVFGLDYFDSVLINGQHQAEYIRKIEQAHKVPQKQIITVGSTYVDELSKKVSALPKVDTTNTILVAPSWGKEALLSRYGDRILKVLLDAKYNVIVRPHPQSYIVEKEMLDNIKNNLKNYSNLSWDQETDNIISMNKSCLMISDFSGVIMDYAVLFKKPIITLKFNFNKTQYDLNDITGDILTFSILDKIGLQVDENSIVNLPNMIETMMSDLSYQLNCEKLANEVWSLPYQAGKQTVNTLIKIQESL